jgi:hypothetical protein
MASVAEWPRPLPKETDAMKTFRPVLWTLAAAALATMTALPAHAGVSIDRTSPSIPACGPPIFPSTVLSQVPAGPPCAVPEVLPAPLGLVANDNIDALSANTPTPANDQYVWVFSGDRGSMGVFGTPYRGEAANNQAASDLWRTGAAPTASPAAVVAAACGAPAMIPPPMPVQHRLQVDYHLVPFLASGVAFGGLQDNIDAVELDDLDPSGDLVHDAGTYFSLDPGSPTLGGGSGADLFFAAAGAGWIPFSAAGNIGLIPANDIDALVIWDRGAIGAMNPGVDVAVFSLTPNSPALAGADGIWGTADDFSAADLFVTDFNGFFCLYTRSNQLGMRFQDNIDGLDAIGW